MVTVLITNLFLLMRISATASWRTRRTCTLKC